MADEPSFNPHPAARPGASKGGVKRNDHFPVSILTRPQGRALQIILPATQVIPGVSILTRPQGRALLSVAAITSPSLPFQSSPGRKAGRFISVSGSSGTDWISFNPHPAARPGASPSLPPNISLLSSFNPHPAARPGASVTGCYAPRPENMFQSSPGRKAGRFCQVYRRRRGAGRVSILTRPQGRALLFSNAASF